MATIAGVEVGGFALPENDSRQQNVSIGQAADATFQFRKFRTSDRLITIILKRKSTTIKDNLGTALEADADYNVSIDPDSPVDLGGGAGVAINAQWVDKQFNAVKVTHDAWDITLNFVRIP